MTRARPSTSSPPRVWNSAPVTRAAREGGASSATPHQSRPNGSGERRASAPASTRMRAASEATSPASATRPAASALRKSSNCRATAATRASNTHHATPPGCASTAAPASE